jgi:hypothetical protein
MRINRTQVTVAGAVTAFVGLALVATPAQAAVNPVYQGVAMPASGSCADVVVDAAVNLAGVPSTGWTKSWAMWANGGKGGDVCVRTLVFAPGSKTWTIAK